MDNKMVILIVVALAVVYFLMNNNKSSNVNWKGYPYSTSGRCGPQFGNTACSGRACCSIFGWCGGETGKPDDWCKTYNLQNGEFDAVKP